MERTRVPKEMKKRLEEAIKETLNCNNCACKEVSECKGTSMCPLYRHALKCAELGYKEAIAQAKEWLEKNLPCSVPVVGDNDEETVSMQTEDFLVVFELAMNRLLGDSN